MNLCKRKGAREVVEEDKTQKAGELKSEAWRGLEENECWGKCEICGGIPARAKFMDKRGSAKWLP